TTGDAYSFHALVEEMEGIRIPGRGFVSGTRDPGGGVPPTPVIVSSLMITLALVRHFPAITSSRRAHRTTVIVGPSAAAAMSTNNANRRARIGISLLHNSSFDAARLLQNAAR